MQSKTDASTSRPLSVGFVSLGCAKNLVDAQLMAGNLVANQVMLATAPEEADVIVVNTCAFIEDAREEAAESILWACELKHAADTPVQAVIVAGCLSQRYKQKLFDAFPDIDAVMGLDELDTVADVARRALKGEAKLFQVSDQAQRLYKPKFPELVFTGGPFAYLKVAEGCNHACAFCAIPAIRGKHRSRTMAELVDETRALVDRGIKEIALISQDVTAYGKDIKATAASLPALLQKLDQIEGNFRIRVLYGYPTFVTDELLAVMAASRHVCHYLDIPIQHSHPDVLKAMLRADTVKPVQALASRVRAAMPDATLRTTCLVGFPGETEEHVQHLLNFVEENRFDHLGAFVFSPEEGTAAWDRDDLPDLDVAEERHARLMTLQQRIVAEKLQAQIGQEQVVLLEQRAEEEAGLWEGRSERQAPEVDGVIYVSHLPQTTEPGQFAVVRILAAREYDLDAEFLRFERPDASEKT